MKKAFLSIFLCALATSQVFCQDRIKELGLAFANFESFGLTYKVGGPRAMWRFNSMFIGGQKLEDGQSNNVEVEQKSFSAGFQAGREFRSDISEKLQLRYGVDVSFSFLKHKSDQRNTQEPYYGVVTKEKSYRPGMNAVLGLNFLLHDKLVLGAEITPGISYLFGKEESSFSNPNYEDVENDISGYSFNASLSSAVLTLAYRFAKVN